jgi:hypothetical protein
MFDVGLTEVLLTLEGHFVAEVFVLVDILLLLGVLSVLQEDAVLFQVIFKQVPRIIQYFCLVFEVPSNVRNFPLLIQEAFGRFQSCKVCN